MEQPDITPQGFDHNRVSKKDWILSLLRDVKSKATRKDRGSDDEVLLKNDLDAINDIANNIVDLIHLEKEDFDPMVVEDFKLQWLAKSINKIKNES